MEGSFWGDGLGWVRFFFFGMGGGRRGDVGCWRDTGWRVCRRGLDEVIVGNGIGS